MLALLASRRFGPLFWTQFFSAFNDNFLKNALVFLILFGMSGPNAETLVTLAGAVFIAPFFFLSGIGGEMADRFDKACLAQRLKLFEILAAGLAVAGFVMHSVPVLFVSLGLFGCIAALFGPIKYGILPDHLAAEDLPAGNALVEGATFIAILLGTIAGGIAAQSSNGTALFGLLIMAFAFACYGASLFIPSTGAGAPNLRVNPNIMASTGALLRDLWADARLWRTGVMTSVFWMVGAVVMSLLPPLIKNAIGGTQAVVSLYFAIFAIAIGVGSAIGAALCSGRIVLWPVPIASLIMGLLALDLAFVVSGLSARVQGLDVANVFTQGTAWRIAIDLAGLAIAGGVFIVPTFAAAQFWAPQDKRARIIAAINVINAAFMVVGALAIGALQQAGLSLSQLFAVIGGLCIVSAIWIFKILPAFKIPPA